MLTPGPKHPITIEPAAERVTVRVGDTVVATTTSALTLREASYPPVYYVPLADVDQSLLKRSTSTSFCPYKGNAGYYSIETAATQVADAGWFYETPYPAVQSIAGHVAFYPQRVEIRTEKV